MLNLAARNPILVESMGDVVLALVKQVVAKVNVSRIIDTNRRKELQ
jgi:hypothetical protein